MTGISVAVMILIAAFAIERIGGALLFLLSYVPSWNEFLPDVRLAEGQAHQIELERRHKLVSVFIASALAVPIVWMFGIEILKNLGAQDIPPLWDRLFSVVVLVAGSDQIRALVKGGEGTHASPPPSDPIHVTGSLILHEKSDTRRVRGE